MASPAERAQVPVLELVAHASDGQTVSLLRVARGERVALAGGSSTGRAALVRALAGLEPPFVAPTDGTAWYGRVLLNGEDLTWVRPEVRRRHWSRIGLVFDMGGLWTGRSLRYNLLLPGVFHGFADTGGWRARVEELIDRLGLREELHRDVVSVELPVRRRTALARALALLPDLLLFDEPQLGLSDEDRRCVADVLAEHRERGMAVVYGDADGDLTPFAVDAYYRLERGRLVPSAPEEFRRVRPPSAESPLEQVGAPGDRAARPGRRLRRRRRKLAG